jgi:hypothetical protein
MGPEYSFFRVENVKNCVIRSPFLSRLCCWKLLELLSLVYVVVTMNVTVQKILFMFGSLPSCWERYVQIFVVKKCFFDFINPAGSCHQEFMIFAGKLSIVIGKLSRFYDLDSILLIFWWMFDEAVWSVASDLKSLTEQRCRSWWGIDSDSIAIWRYLTIFTVDALFDVYEMNHVLCLACWEIFKLSGYS